MKEPIRDQGRLEHILQAVQNALEFGKDQTVESLNNDPMRYYAITKNIEIIGEAAYMLTDDFKEKHPQSEWRTIIGMRHALVHGYYQISREEVISVLKNDLLPLRHQIESYLSETCV